MKHQVVFNNKNYEIFCHEFDEYISDYIKKGEFYETPFLSTIYKRKYKNIIDIGANIGNHSAFFSQVMGAKVWAFEPQKDNYLLLKKNNPNGVNYNVGLGADTWTADSIINLSNMGASSLVAGDEVEVHTLDSYHLKPDFIKIDVEGMEADVIIGGLDTIKKYKPDMVIEHNSLQELYNTADLLTPLGYWIKPFTEKTWELFEYKFIKGAK